MDTSRSQPASANALPAHLEGQVASAIEEALPSALPNSVVFEASILNDPEVVFPIRLLEHRVQILLRGAEALVDLRLAKRSTTGELANDTPADTLQLGNRAIELRRENRRRLSIQPPADEPGLALGCDSAKLRRELCE